MTFNAFTDEQWQAIRAVRDDWPEGIDWEEARQQIEGIGWAYWTMRAQRSQFGPPAKVLESARGAMRHTRKLRDALKALPDNLLRWLDLDPLLTELERRLESLLLIYERLTGPEFSRRSDYYRDWLYEGLLSYWERSLGGELSFSRRPDNTPYGPLVDFLTLTVNVILGKAPGPSRIAKIIDQYRKSRDFPL